MKTLLTLLVMGCLLASCSNKPDYTDREITVTVWVEFSNGDTATIQHSEITRLTSFNLELTDDGSVLLVMYNRDVQLNYIICREVRRYEFRKIEWDVKKNT